MLQAIIWFKMLQAPLRSMQLAKHAKHKFWWHRNCESLIWIEFNRILGILVLMTNTFNYSGWLNFSKLISTLCLFVGPFHPLMFYHQDLLYTTWSSGITHYVSKCHSKSLLMFSMLIGTYFDQKVPRNFLQSSMELFEQHLNNICGYMEFHGT